MPSSSREKKDETKHVCTNPVHPSECRCMATEVEVVDCDQTVAARGSRLLKSLLVSGRIEPAPANAVVGKPNLSSCYPSAEAQQHQLSHESTDKSSHKIPRLVFRKLEAQEQATIRKIVRCFVRSTRKESRHRRQAATPHRENVDSFVLLSRNTVLSLLEFACYLPEFKRKPPYVQVALAKAASTSYLLLRLVQAYDVTLNSWRDERSTLFEPNDMARLLPSTSQEFWCHVASLAGSVKTLLCGPAGDGVRRSDDGCEDRGGLASFALLHVIQLMSPEHVPYRRERDRDIATGVSDCQQAYILLLRHHLEASQSVTTASWMLPTLLESMAAIKRYSSIVRNALLSVDSVRSDPVLSDALSLVSLPVNSRRARRAM